MCCHGVSLPAALRGLLTHFFRGARNLCGHSPCLRNTLSAHHPPVKAIASGNSRAVFGLFLGVQTLVPLVSSVLFRSLYHSAFRTVFYHLVIVVFAYLVLFGVASLPCLLRAVRSRKPARYALPLAWGIGSVALYFCYLLAWGGRLSMGMNLTPALVAPYALHPSLIVANAPVPPTLLCLALLVIPGAILCAYLAGAKSFAAVLLRGRMSLARASRVPLPPARQCLLLTGALGSMLTVGAVFFQWPPAAWHTRLFGDPIFVPVRGEGVILPITRLDANTDAQERDYQPPTQFRKKNVVLIVVDACRADHLGVLGYERDTTPFLDSLRRDGHLRAVRSFYSASCCTFGGVLTLLRSRHWFNMTLRAFALPDVLKKAGFRVHFVLGGDHANFANLKEYYGRSFDTYSDGNDPARRASLNDDRGVLESLERIGSYDGTPAFFYFHLMSVHPLGPREERYVRYRPASAALVGNTPEQYGNNYDNGVLQADDHIRELFERLKAKGYLQDSLVVITSDHGESIGERGVFGHSSNLYNEEVTPPLLIYDTDPVEYRNFELARQIDVAPTILDRLGLPIPSCWDGRSLLREGPARFAYLRMADTYAVIDHTPEHTLKYIYNHDRKREEVYDEDHDPHDQQNLFQTTDPKEIQELRAAVGAFSVHPGS